MNDEDARAVYQRLLDDIGASYLDDNFDAFATSVGVPHNFTTEESVIEIKTQEGLRGVFDSFRRYLSSQGVTQFIRTCSWAKFDASDCIRGGHETHFLQPNGHRVRAPYSVTSTLKLQNDRWMVFASENSIPPVGWPAHSAHYGAAMDRKEDL